MTWTMVIAIASIGFNVVLIVALIKFESVKVNTHVNVEVNGRKILGEKK